MVDPVDTAGYVSLSPADSTVKQTSWQQRLRGRLYEFVHPTNGYYIYLLLFLYVGCSTMNKVYYKAMLWPMEPYSFYITTINVAFYIPTFLILSCFFDGTVKPAQSEAEEEADVEEIIRKISVSENQVPGSPIPLTDVSQSRDRAISVVSTHSAALGYGRSDFSSNLDQVVLDSFGYDAASVSKDVEDEKRRIRKVVQLCACGLSILDNVSMLLHAVSASHIPGPVMVLLGQAVIPCTVICSIIFVRASFTIQQYIGALIVLGGIVLAVCGRISDAGAGDIVYDVLYFSAALPVAAGYVLREKFLHYYPDISPLRFSLWIAIWQFFILIPMAFVVAPLQNIPIGDLPKNFYDGTVCFIFGTNNDTTKYCGYAPSRVSIYLFCNMAVNCLCIFIFKYGSAAILVIAGAITIPLSNIVFVVFPSITGSIGGDSFTIFDGVGLAVILIGMTIYKCMFDSVTLSSMQSGVVSVVILLPREAFRKIWISSHVERIDNLMTKQEYRRRSSTIESFPSHVPARSRAATLAAFKTTVTSTENFKDHELSSSVPNNRTSFLEHHRIGVDPFGTSTKLRDSMNDIN